MTKKSPVEFSAVYLLHGMAGSPNGSVLQLELELRACAPNNTYVRPLMPHSDPTIAPSESVDHLFDLGIPEGALLVGISLGGLAAAKLQELERPDLHVICINSPTWTGDVELVVCVMHRVSLYCSNDEVIAGRTEDWPLLATEAHDLTWLDGHDIDPHKEALAHLINCYMRAGCLNWECR